MKTDKGTGWMLHCGIGLAAYGMLAACQAASLNVQLSDGAGAALQDAVVAAIPEGGAPAKSNAGLIKIEQNGRKFIPAVTVLQTGSAVSFPNLDTVRHHIYSFSPAKKFEMKLYSGVPSENVVFDKPGVVTLGCNIHDKMIAWVVVVDTPYFAKSDAKGELKLDLPKGKYNLRVWHAQQAGSASAEQSLQITEQSQHLQIKVQTKGAPPLKQETKADELIY
ncbi:methylamine utilization protein [Massilia sp. W12]|uniref:methylamine utilization protein n=1 Tax=Massilia sp. W12 TaxID=3126507 RepID=UPI0030D17B9D